MVPFDPDNPAAFARAGLADLAARWDLLSPEAQATLVNAAALIAQFHAVHPVAAPPPAAAYGPPVQRRADGTLIARAVPAPAGSRPPQYPPVPPSPPVARSRAAPSSPPYG
jgi:hypothetical protein